jgi:hypothetical protein
MSQRLYSGHSRSVALTVLGSGLGLGEEAHLSKSEEPAAYAVASSRQSAAQQIAQADAYRLPRFEVALVGNNLGTRGFR